MRRYSIGLVAVVLFAGTSGAAKGYAQSAQETGESNPAVAMQAPAPPDTAVPPGRRPPEPVPPEPPGYQHIKVTSSMDGTERDVAMVVPQRELAEPLGLVVYLHGWSVGYTDRRPSIEAEAEKRGWLLAIPDYRGPFVNHCGNEYAQQDILDTVNWAKANYPVDEDHIYLVGFSGGGFMSMIMAYKYPDVWAAVSSWSGFGDLLVNYARDKDNRYGESMRTCFGGDPDISPEVAEQFRERSPINHFTPGMKLPPLDLNAQKDDPLVPVQSSMRAFRVLAPGLLSDEDLEVLQRGEPFPAGSHLRIDQASGREIYLRRELDNLRLTIRPGNHEVLGAPAFEWFDQFSRQ